MPSASQCRRPRRWRAPACGSAPAMWMPRRSRAGPASGSPRAAFSTAARRFFFSASFASRRRRVTLERVDLHRQLVVAGQELVQRRVDQPDDHRQALHGPEDAVEVGALERQQLVERTRRRSASSLARIICCTMRQAVGLEEHVLGAAQADALGAELARALGVARVVGVGPHLQAAEARRPSPAASSGRGR